MDEAQRLLERTDEVQEIDRREKNVRHDSTTLDCLIRLAFDTDPSAVSLSRVDTGEFVDVNAGFCDLTGYTREDVVGSNALKTCLWEDPADRRRLVELLAENGETATIEAPFRIKSGEVRRGLMSARRIDIDDIAYLVTVTRDVEDERRTEDLLQRTTRALQAISYSNRALLHAQDEKTLLQAICGCITFEAGYRFAWVGFADKESTRVVPMAWAGHESGYLDEIDVPFPCGESEAHPAGLAILENRVVVCHEIRSCDSACPWRRAALDRGYLAVISLPLHVDDETVGSLNIYSTREFSFMEEENRLLQELAGDLSFGISSLRAGCRHEESERQRRLDREKFRSVFAQSSEGIALVDGAGLIIEWNQAMEGLTGFSRSDVLSQPIERFMDLALPSTPDAELAQIEIGKQICEWLEDPGGTFVFHPVEISVQRPDGKACVVRVSVFPVKTIDDRLCGWICTDVTSERDAARKAKKAMDGSIEAMARVTEMRDPYTSGHQLQVELLSRRIAEELGLSEEVSEALRVAASLHDVGKIAVPAEILAKPSALEEHELGLIRRHPDVGFELLAPIDFPWQIAEIVRQHHERMDGSGYPRGLRGEAVMIEARIIGVADVVEAMSSHRPYRPALGIDAAIREIQKGRGSRYDSQVVDACVRVLQRGLDEDDD